MVNLPPLNPLLTKEGKAGCGKVEFVSSFLGKFGYCFFELKNILQLRINKKMSPAFYKRHYSDNSISLMINFFNLILFSPKALSLVAIGPGGSRATRSVRYVMGNFPIVEDFGVKGLGGPRVCLEGGLVNVEWRINNVTESYVGAEAIQKLGSLAEQGDQEIGCDSEVEIEALRKGSNFFGNVVLYPKVATLGLDVLELELVNIEETNIPYSQIESSASESVRVNLASPMLGEVPSLRIRHVSGNPLMESIPLRGSVTLQRLDEGGQFEGDPILINFGMGAPLILEAGSFVEINLSDDPDGGGPYRLRSRQDYRVTEVRINSEDAAKEDLVSVLNPSLDFNFTTGDEGLETWLRFKEVSGVVYDWASGDSFSILGVLDYQLGGSDVVGLIGSDYLLGSDVDYVNASEGLTVEMMVRVDEGLESGVDFPTYALPAMPLCDANTDADAAIEYADTPCEGCMVLDPFNANSDVTGCDCPNPADPLFNLPGTCELSVDLVENGTAPLPMPVNAPYIASKDGEFALGMGAGASPVTGDLPKWQLALGLSTSCDQGMGYLVDPVLFSGLELDNTLRSVDDVVQGVFTHVVGRLVVDPETGNNDDVSLFINGVDNITGPYNADNLNSDCPRPLSINALDSINAAMDPQTIYNNLDISMSEMLIYSRPLTDGEITSHYHSASDAL